ncbi:GspE/PulE family protein [Geomobilimonas luticola]|uniref:Flp pilus assembly complex ATPase component TadA n=1 Tax=Geomobilimonas luticola TaxID=1114878 RepID=A0ABS5S9Y2_9BACT|nr:GspE/PulE family protein [Geomobilimonas luticola]MBT0652181.1 Flp pilus assembly complex ATPase component TadA [Geomobilimonas luticola]
MPEKLGELLIRNGLVSEAQFMAALEKQQEFPCVPIGQVLCQLGFLSSVDLNMVLDYNRKRLKLGEILVKQNHLDEAKLNNALQIAEKEHIPLGQALVRLHYLDEEKVARAIAAQYDLPFVPLDTFSFDPELARLINVNYAQRHRIVPIGKVGKVVTLAMAFPLRSAELHELAAVIDMEIKPAIARESDITTAQHRIYRIVARTSQTEKENLHFEVSEDIVRESGKSRYVDDFISADVDYLVKKIISVAIKTAASDIHLESREHGMEVRFRIDGVLQSLDLGQDAVVINDNAKQIVSKIKILCDMDIAEKRRPQDSSFKLKVTRDGAVRSVDFRVSTVPTQFGENVVIRILDKRGGAISLDTLGFQPSHVDSLCRTLEKPTGIFLVTGPTGSGKSSTLYAILNRISSNEVKTLTVEDPIEYSIDGVCQSEVNEAIGNTFARFLRSFLRQDPDNIMVGEIRDLETASISIRAALTGHTVMSTLHTNDATSAFTRLMDMGVEPSLLSSTLRCVLAQRLVRRICDHCKVRYTPAKEILGEFRFPETTSHPFARGSGCVRCNFTGFAGRRPIAELWVPTGGEVLLFNKRPDNQTLREMVFNQGQRMTLIEDGLRRVKTGETTLEELLRVVPYEHVEECRNRMAAKLFSWDAL